MKINLNPLKDTLLYDFMLIKNYSTCQFKRRKQTDSYTEQFRIIERNSLLEGYFFWNNYHNKDNYGLTLIKNNRLLMETVIFDKNNKLFNVINVYNIDIYNTYDLYGLNGINKIIENKSYNIKKNDIKPDIINSLRVKDDRHIIRDT